MGEVKVMEALKDLGAAAAALAGIAYASGYLVLRARARALGTDPSLGLVEEAYVFAGFRFVLSLLIALLLMLPVIGLVRAAALWLARVLPAPAQEVAQWAAIAFLVLVVLLEFRVLGVSNVLLAADSGGAGDALADAVVGRNALGFWLVLGTAGLAAVSLLWLVQGARSAPVALNAALALLVTLQVLLLPIYHGMFFADQTVRVLDGVPAKAAGLVAPVAIVDRGGEHVTLLGPNKQGGRRLVIVARKDLEGVGVSNVTAMRHFLDMLAKAGRTVALAVPLAFAAGGGAGDAVAAAHAPDTKARLTMEAGETRETFWKAVVDYLKNTLEYVGALGEGRAESGQVWIAEVHGATLKAAARPLAPFKGLSWPVFGPGGEVHALEAGRVIRLEPDGRKTALPGSQADWVKLIGVGADGSVLGIVADPPFGRVAILRAQSGLAIGPAPATPEEKKRQAALLQESRSYADGRRLSLRYSQRGRGLDVFLEAPGNAAANLSDCGDDACGQASLSPDGARVAWIRSAAE
jgi:hypothetical protein